MMEAAPNLSKFGNPSHWRLDVFNLINLSDLNFSTLSVYWILLMSVCLTLICIVFYIIGFVMPKKAEELLIEAYPEYKLV